MKRNKLTRIFFISIIVLLFSVGCTTIKESSKPKQEAYISPTQGLNKCATAEIAGKKMIDSILKGLSNGNYALYSRDFTVKNKKYFDRSIFDQAHEAVKEKLGLYKDIKYVGFWKKGNYDILLWKARFAEIKDDILVEMYVIKQNEGYKIAALKLI